MEKEKPSESGKEVIRFLYELVKKGEVDKEIFEKVKAVLEGEKKK